MVLKWLRKMYRLLFSHSVVSSSFATPWTVAHQAPLSMEFPRQEHWSGLPGDLPDPGITPASPGTAYKRGRGTQRPSPCEQLGDLGEAFLRLF